MLVSSHAFNTFSQIRSNVTKIMDKLDPDGSNSITLAEFQANSPMKSTGRPPPWPLPVVITHRRLIPKAFSRPCPPLSAPPRIQDGLIRYPDIVQIFDRCFGTKEGDSTMLKGLRAQQ